MTHPRRLLIASYALLALNGAMVVFWSTTDRWWNFALALIAIGALISSIQTTHDMMRDGRGER